MTFPFNYDTFRTTPYVLNFIFVGQAYTSFHEFTAVPAASSVWIQLDIGARIHHQIARTVSTSGGGNVLISVWENATFTTGSTPPAMPPRGLDRRVGASNPATTTFFINPTAINTASATLIARERVFAQGSGSNASAESTISDFERVLAPNASYLVQFQNTGSQATDIAIHYLYYESGN